MTNQISTQTISFNNQSLITFEQNGTHYTAMRPICENIGLDWKAQYRRISDDEVLNSTVVMMTIVAEDGKNRQMVCLPINYLNGWLFGIDVKRVKPEIRDTLLKYKKECYQALCDYWFTGKAEKPKATEDTIDPNEQRLIQNAVNAMHKNKGISYAEIWSRIKNKFRVAKYEQLKKDQFHDVMIYIASMQPSRFDQVDFSQRAEKDDEMLKLFVTLYGYCYQAREMREKLEKAGLSDQISQTIGGQYLYNLHHPLEQAMQQAKTYIQSNTERLVLVKAMAHLLN